MAYTILIDGVPVQAETAEDALALAKASKKSGVRAAPETLVKQPPGASTRKAARKKTIKKGIGFLKLADPDVALRFLKTIRDAGPTGVEQPIVMKLLGVTHPKGVGSVSGQINRLLTQSSVSPALVYQNPKGPNGRVWKQGKHINQAIAALERRAAAN